MKSNSKNPTAGKQPVAPVVAAKTTARTAVKQAVVSHGRYAGKRIKPVEMDNPRREGSEGWVNYEIVLSAGKKGLKYEDFIAAGGKSNQLHWDVQHGFVKIV